MNYSHHVLLTVLFALPAFTLSVSGHHSWIIPSSQEKKVEIGHGHNFPESEQAMKTEGLHVLLFDTRGRSYKVTSQREEGRLTAAIPDEVSELRSALFHEDPVILNRTPQGVRIGPMTRYEGVVDSFRRHRSGAFISSPGVPFTYPKMVLAIDCSRESDRLILTCRIGNQALKDVSIDVREPGPGEDRTIGSTDADGRLVFSIIKAGLHLFSAHFSRNASGSETQRDEFISSLTVLIN